MVMDSHWIFILWSRWNQSTHTLQIEFDSLYLEKKKKFLIKI